MCLSIVGCRPATRAKSHVALTSSFRGYQPKVARAFRLRDPQSIELPTPRVAFSPHLLAVRVSCLAFQRCLRRTRFFTGLRPSEEIALEVDDCDLVQGEIQVNKARGMRRDRDRTKNSEDRIVELCPRALDVLKRQLALRARLKLAGEIHHENVFFWGDGSPIRSLNDPYDCWHWTLERLKNRYRPPYNARHSSVSWNLMLGKNRLWVSKNHGHSVTTMFTGYAAWIEGAKEADIAAIRQAMDASAYAARAMLPTRSPPKGQAVPGICQ
jgi:integrase